MEKIGVIGAGSWGTALAILLNENGNDVTLWSHRAEEAAKVQKDREISKLPGIHIPESIAVTADLAETVCGKRCLCLSCRQRQCVRRRKKCVRMWSREQ